MLLQKGTNRLRELYNPNTDLDQGALGELIGSAYQKYYLIEGKVYHPRICKYVDYEKVIESLFKQGYERIGHNRFRK